MTAMRRMGMNIPANIRGKQIECVHEPPTSIESPTTAKTRRWKEKNRLSKAA